MFIHVPVMIAHKADRSAADGVRLAVEDVDTRTVLHDHNLMKIMMMFRKGSLGQPRLNRHRRVA